MECALSQNVLLPLLMVHFVTRMYYYYYYYYITVCVCSTAHSMRTCTVGYMTHSLKDARLQLSHKLKELTSVIRVIG